MLHAFHSMTVECLLVWVVIFPGTEVADVARAAEAGGPGLIGFHDRVIQADGERATRYCCFSKVIRRERSPALAGKFKVWT
jgi:hypothetical protein